MKIIKRRNNRSDAWVFMLASDFVPEFENETHISDEAMLIKFFDFVSDSKPSIVDGFRKSRECTFKSYDVLFTDDRISIYSIEELF